MLCAVGLTITLLYHELPDSQGLLARISQYLFFLPIVMAGLWFGWRGGILAAVVCAVLYLPRLLLFWQSAPPYDIAQYAEALDLMLVGSILGVLADRERRKAQALEQTATALRATYQELQRSLEHLKRAERLSGIGQLTANLAHEIRNPLASIEGAAGLLETPDALPEEQRREFVGIIKAESRRLSRLLTEMLDYSRARKPEFHAADLAGLVRRVVNLVTSSAARARVEIVTDFPASLPPVECDASQIMQVLMNLLLNAIQAMPSGGTIHIQGEQAADYVAVSVRDQGPGVPDDDLDKLFSPFFTTKKEGTGLGLAVAQQIAVRHGGEIAVKNQSGGGAVFSLLLPVVRRGSSQSS